MNSSFGSQSRDRICLSTTKARRDGRRLHIDYEQLRQKALLVAEDALGKRLVLKETADEQLIVLVRGDRGGGVLGEDGRMAQIAQEGVTMTNIWSSIRRQEDGSQFRLISSGLGLIPHLFERSWDTTDIGTSHLVPPEVEEQP